MILKDGTSIANKYRVVGLIGSGGMGTVYRVTHLQLHSDLALKIIDVHKQTELAIRRFHQEAVTTAQLKHPNLVAVHDFGIYDDEQPYLVMDLIQGETLSAMLKQKGALSIDYVVPLAIELAKGLRYAHSLGVVHRDIKPGNIIILKPDEKPTLGSVKIVDFGIAKLAQSEDGQMQELTRTGEIFGSPIYMSPEQCQGSTIDQRTDIYALGCVLFECLTGSPPFLAENAMTTMAKRLTHEPETLKEGSLGVEFPQAIEDIVNKMLQLNPAARYQDLDSVISDLNEYQQGEANAPAVAVSSSKEQRKHSSSMSALIDAALFITSAAVFATATHYVDTHFLLKPSSIVSAPANASDKLVKHSDQEAESLGGIARAPTLESEASSAYQYITFPDSSGFYFYGQPRDKDRNPIAEGRVRTSRENPIGLSLNELAASNQRFFKYLHDAYINSIDFRGIFMMGNEHLADVGQMKHLHVLNLVNCNGVTNLSPISNLPELDGLYAEGTSVSTEEFLALPYLKRLSAFGFGPVNNPSRVLTELQKEDNCGRLDYTGPSKTANGDDDGKLKGLTTSDLRIISKTLSYEEVRLKDCIEVNDKNIGLLIHKEGKPLQILSLENCGVTPNSISELAKHKWQVLNIENDNWSAADNLRLTTTIQNALVGRPQKGGIDGMVERSEKAMQKTPESDFLKF